MSKLNRDNLTGTTVSRSVSVDGTHLLYAVSLCLAVVDLLLQVLDLTVRVDPQVSQLPFFLPQLPLSLRQLAGLGLELGRDLLHLPVSLLPH